MAFPSKDISDVMQPLALSAGVSGGVLSTVGAYNKSVADRAAFETQAGVASANAVLDDARARDAVTRGQGDVARSDLRTRQLKGEQVASLAARGLDLSYGSPLNILTDTDLMGASDSAIIAANAAKEAWGHRVSETNNRANSELYARRARAESPFRSATTSALTSAGAVASSWYNSKKN